jgi:tRNA pseudouridine synthase 10
MDLVGEDIDARMVGSGRPFVMEVINPLKRFIDLKALEARINENEKGRVAVTFDGYTDRSAVESIKSKKAYKKYRILVEVDGSISLEELNNALEQLRGAVIHQRTPLRVAHRRADKVRERRVIDIGAVRAEGGRFCIDISGEAGLYIKELISGDGGRTDPSLSGIIGKSARVTSLDVVQVEDTDDSDQSCQSGETSGHGIQTRER